MEPRQRIRHVFYNLERKLLKSVGHDFHQNGEFKPTSYTYFLYGVNALVFTSCVYTVIWYDIATGLNSIGYGAVSIQLVSKIFLMRYAPQMINAINRIIDVYDQNAETKSCERASMLQKVSRLSELLLIRGTIAYILVGLLHFLNPIYGYFWRHEFKPLMPLYIPFVDENTAFGFTILMSIQTIQLFATFLSSACTDFPFLIFVMNIWAQSTIFKETVSELNGILHEESGDMSLVNTKLRNIFEMYNDNWMLIDDLNTIAFTSNFVLVLFAAISAATELFICLIIAFMPAVFLAGVFLFQICGSCAVGTVIVLYNDRISESLIDCDWYLLPITEQMKFKFLVMHANFGKTLTLGDVRPLNMELCVSILRKIYSYVMVLRKIIA